MPLFGSKINSIKVKSIFTLNLILERIKTGLSKFKDIDKILRTLSKGLNEAAAEVRSISKEGFMIFKENIKRNELDLLI